MLDVQNLSTVFQVHSHEVTAVDQISFQIPEKTVVGLVGESGSGKSVTSQSILQILPPNGQIKSGQLHWKGQDLMQLSRKELQQIRGKEIGMIFQNPLSALNPVFTIGNQLIETICLHQNTSPKEARKIAASLLKKVNIPDPETRLDDYPHQFSIGMCQRIMIALSIASRPQLLIADEPTASLDVTIQAQILSLLNDLKSELNMSILLISHDLGVIAQHCDHILVMYLGKIVESGSPQDIFKSPLHPYTQALIKSIPIPDPNIKQAPELIKGDIPSPMNLPSGCRFHPRCPEKLSKCEKECPSLNTIKNTHKAACWLY
ncbi:MAG: peptide ABC transporter ATP-binding protein [Actinobacteria bacterium]|nr:peptide ABC transporter ATP-binding protein [Actinomycetota bacterium]